MKKMAIGKTRGGYIFAEAFTLVFGFFFALIEKIIVVDREQVFVILLDGMEIE